MASSAVIAKRYARALVGLAKTPADAAKWLEPMALLAETVRNSPELARLLNSHGFSEADKWAVVSELAKKYSVPTELERYLKMLVDSQRINALAEISLAFKNMLLEQQNTVEATVESATELTAPQKQKIQELLEKTMNKKVVIKTQIVPSLLAGFRVKVAGFTMDASLQANIDAIHKNLLSSEFARKGVRAEA